MAVNRSSRDMLMLLAAGLALGIVLIANELGDRAFLRVDLTAERRYTLSEPFQNIVKRLDDKLKITYFVSGDVPEVFKRNKRDLLDKLAEIRIAGGRKIELEIVDPTGDEKIQKELEERDAVVKVQSVEKDKASVAAMTTAIRLTFKDKPAVWLPRVFNAEYLEYMLGNQIISLSLTPETRPVIAIRLPAPDMPMDPSRMRQRPTTGFEWMLDKQNYEDKFDLRPVEISENSPIPEKTRLLVLVRPKELSERAKYEILKYLSSGGKVLLIDNPTKVNFQEQSWEKTTSGLESYLEEQGLEIKKDLICDTSCVQLPVVKSGFRVSLEPIAVFVKVLPQNLNQEDYVTKMLPSLVLPFPTEIKLNKDKLKAAGLKGDVLARTTNMNWSYVPPAGSLTLNDIKEPAAKDPAKTVFAKLEGIFPFPFEGRVAPDWPKDKDKEEPPKKDEKKDANKEVGKFDKKPGLLLAWSAPESFHEFYLSNPKVGQEFVGNQNVVPNILESCALGEDLIHIRAKSYATRTITRFEGDNVTRNLVKILLLAGMALVVLIAGLLRWFLRRSAQLRYERTYSGTTGPSSFTP